MALSYTEQLQDQRWIDKSDKIKERDNNTCQICGTKEHYVYVHHICYLPDTLAWEYDDELLQTVCRKHHEQLTYDMPKVAGIIAFQALKENIDLIQLYDLLKRIANGI